MRRELSVEKMVRRAQRRMVFWRLLGDLIEIPAKLCQILAEGLVGLANVFMSVSRTVFYMELHAAREYLNLTGADLAYAMGETNRYAGMDARRLNDLRETQRRQIRATLEQQFDVELGEE